MNDRSEASTVSCPGEPVCGSAVVLGGSWPRSIPRNPHLKFHNHRRGYVRCTVNHREWHADFRTVPYVTTPGAPVETKAGFAIEAGHAGAVPA